MDTLIAQFSKARTANSTDSAFASRVPTTTKPADDGVLQAVAYGRAVRSSVLIEPFGAGGDNTTLDVRVIGWAQASGLWIPTILCQVACTLSGALGVSGATVLNTERFADIITLTSPFGTSGVDVLVSSPANDTPGHIVVDAKGHQLVELLFKTGTATNGNALVAWL